MATLGVRISVIAFAIRLGPLLGDGRPGEPRLLSGRARRSGRCAGGEAERSARLFGAAERTLGAVEAPVYDVYGPNRSFYEQTLSAARSRLGEAAFEEAWSAGREMDVDQAVEYALQNAEASPLSP
jgi:hypothetical protein